MGVRRRHGGGKGRSAPPQGPSRPPCLAVEASRARLGSGAGAAGWIGPVRKPRPGGGGGETVRGPPSTAPRPPPPFPLVRKGRCGDRPWRSLRLPSPCRSAPGKSELRAGSEGGVSRRSEGCGLCLAGAVVRVLGPCGPGQE